MFTLPNRSYQHSPKSGAAKQTVPPNIAAPESTDLPETRLNEAGRPSESCQSESAKIRQIRPGTIRKVWHNEADKFRDHLLRLDKKSRRLRFAHSVSDRFIEDYATRMTDMGAVVYGLFDEGEIRAVAELRKLSDSWGIEAEAAFSVESGFQNMGVGSELMGRIIRSARNRRIRHLYMSCLPENSRMQRIAKKHSAELRFEFGDIVGDIVPQRPDYISMVAEAVEDRVGYMMAVLDIQNRLSRDTSAT